MHDLAPHVRVWIESPSRDEAFGDGKICLLQAIDEEGSLQAAAKKLGISYRKAWGDLKKAESCLDRTLLDKTRGGREGGRTALTAEGHALVDAFTTFRRNVDAAVESSFQEFTKAL
jgi:molybdate transport system regulatory protein